MRPAHRLIALLSLLAFSLQVAAAPLGLTCTHPAPEQAVAQMAADTGEHAHHQMHADQQESAPQLNCEMGCNCGGGCVHACQLSFAQPSFHISELVPEPVTGQQHSGAPHHAYNSPLLRPPASL